MNKIMQNKLKIFFVISSLLFLLNVNSQTVTTFAGSSNYGQTDGMGGSATFYHPFGITTDVNGNIYTADAYTHRIRKITPIGLVTTFAGSTQGYIDAIGTEAQFSSPSGLAADTLGNVYIADTNNNCIRKITSDGVVTTLAGGTQGYDNGTGTDAQFFHPSGVAVDIAGNVFVADKYNNRIQKITPDGVVTTFAGSATGIYFNTPFGVSVDSNGNVFVADTYNNRIVKITADGVANTLAGGNGQGNIDGLGTIAKFFYPVDIEVDNSGNVFVADTENNLIRKITPDGLVTTLAGSTQGFADGIGINSKFNKPYGITIDPNEALFVADLVNHRIRKIVSNLSTTDYQLENQISIYPNPASSIINIKLTDITANKALILDMNGRTLQSENIINKSTVGISNLANGIYLMQITTDKGIVSKKIVKN